MTAPRQSQAIILANRPQRGPITNETFKQVTRPVPELKEGQVLVRLDYVSVDPTMRTWINDTRNYMTPVKIGAVMRAGGIGRVIQSRSDTHHEGDLVVGTFGWQEYWVGPAAKAHKRSVPRGGRDVDHLGLFGTSGMTAYFGMFDIGRLKDGDNVAISGAAGSVGLITVQIALAHPKCRVTAIAGSVDKVEQLRKMGCHHVLNYKDADFHKQLKKVGLVDLYFDNVGGPILDRILMQLNPYARIVACGAISQYSAEKPYGVRGLTNLVSMKARIHGFIVFDYADRFPEAEAYLAALRQKGKMSYDYTIIEPDSDDGAKTGDKQKAGSIRRTGTGGIGRCVEALEGVFEGRNRGKTLVRISAADKTRAKL